LHHLERLRVGEEVVEGFDEVEIEIIGIDF
jgi:hypothetical protein